MKALLSLLALFTHINFASSYNHLAYNAYDFNFKDLEGNQVNLNNFKGKLILMVKDDNICGFTRDLFDLEKLYSSYKNRGFEIMLITNENTIKKCKERSSWVNYKILTYDNKDFIEWVSNSSDNNEAKQILISPFGNIIQAYYQKPKESLHEIQKDIEYNLPNNTLD